MQYLEERDAIVTYGASLFARGFSFGSSGNISTRVSGGYLMTPTNSSLGRLRADTLSLLSPDWHHIAGARPSKEVAMHEALYQVQPEASAIVHLHSVHVTALSCLSAVEGPLIQPITPYFVMRTGGDVPVVSYFAPGDAAIGAEIKSAGLRSRAIILANHGSLVAGATLEDAVNSAEELEVSAQLTLMLRGLPARVLTDAEVANIV